jgi:exodeoxyribonuclease V alpha subunit
MKSTANHSIPEIFSLYFNDALIRKLAYLVSSKLEEGNICIDLIRHNSESDENISIDELKNSPYVSQNAEANIQPFILADNNVYLHRYFDYETRILNKIHLLLKYGAEQKNKKKQQLLEKTAIVDSVFNTEMRLKPQAEKIIPWQKVSTLASFINSFQIITGGPGTGKTSAIAKFLLLQLSFDPQTKIAVAAPTGKAAARLNESLSAIIEKLPDEFENIKTQISSVSAKTIHRLLGIRDSAIAPTFGVGKKLNYDVVIIDESSMIDVGLMAKLMDAIDESSKLILAGDRNQLSSIGAGSIFGDLCRLNALKNVVSKADSEFYNKFSGEDEIKIRSDEEAYDRNYLPDNIIELQHSFRFSNDKGIGKFSNSILNDTDIGLSFLDDFRSSGQEEYLKISPSTDDPEFAALMALYEEYALEEDIGLAFEKLKRIRILCAVRDGVYGVSAFNAMIENHLSDRRLIYADTAFYHKQPVMVTANDYSLGVFNGDMGIVRKDPETALKYVYFEDNSGILTRHTVASLPACETAYAMTIHKSQGSEFENVIIILPGDQEHSLLTRELLYTAATRAKKKVLLVAEDQAILNTIHRQTERISGISERFKNLKY